MVKNAENYFRITRGIIDPVKTSAALSQMPLDKTQGEEPPVPSGPGDIPMFLLHANKSFIRWGETVEYRLMPLQEITQKLYVHGRVYRPGLNGHYDGTYPVTYFGGETGNGAGAIYPGPRPGDFIPAFTRRVNGDELVGEHLIDFVISDEQGNLIQQIWVSLYVVNTGTFTPWVYIGKVFPGGNGPGEGLIARGRFPIGLPLYHMVGVPQWGFGITSPDPDQAPRASSDGTVVHLSARLRFPQTTAIDVMMWAPGYRQALIGSQIFVEKAFTYPQ